MADVLVIGSAVADFVFSMETIPDEPRKYRADSAEIVGGGCAANAAVAIARLGGKAFLAARLGDDPVGDLIAADLQAEGVDLSLVNRAVGGQSSFSSICIDAAGERQIVNFRGAGLTESADWLGATPPVQAVLADTRWNEGAKRGLELARDRGIPGVLDGEAPVDPDVAACASHVAFSRDGLRAFSGHDDLRNALADASARLPGWVCVTDGENGVYYIDGGGIVHLPAYRVAVKDTLGAGDAWHGAFALALGEGQDPARAIRFANATAALKCMTFGGRKGCPDRAAVDSFLKENT
ncbi:MAG: sugar kinase [Rhodobacteraceae bacterium]|nr:sugar kinase [Paracoccaceae bacterium]